jgi:archaellum component FlaC
MAYFPKRHTCNNIVLLGKGVIRGKGFRGMQEFIYGRAEEDTDEEDTDDEEEPEPEPKRQKKLINRFENIPDDIIEKIANFRGIKSLNRIMKLEKSLKSKIKEYNDLYEDTYGEFEPDINYFAIPTNDRERAAEQQLANLRNEIREIENELDIFIRDVNKSAFPYSSDL